LNFSNLNRFDQQWLYCGFRGPYSCGAAGEFSSIPHAPLLILDFGFQPKD